MRRSSEWLLVGSVRRQLFCVKGLGVGVGDVEGKSVVEREKIFQAVSLGMEGRSDIIVPFCVTMRAGRIGNSPRSS